jgi:hypothetical protein
MKGRHYRLFVIRRCGVKEADAMLARIRIVDSCLPLERAMWVWEHNSWGWGNESGKADLKSKLHVISTHAWVIDKVAEYLEKAGVLLNSDYGRRHKTL